MGDARAGGAYVEVYVKDKLKQGFDQMGSKLNGYAQAMQIAGGALMGAAGASLAAATAAVFAFSSHADNIADGAALLDVATESYQALSFAASQTGASMQDVESSFGKLQKIIGQAELGNKIAIKTLEKYGLSWKMLRDLSPEDQLDQIAEVIRGLPDQTTRAAAAVELLGKSGLKLIPMLYGGAEGMEAFRAQAIALGLVMSESDIESGGKLADTLSTVKQQAWALVATIGAALAPAMQRLIEIGRGVLAWVIKFIDTNRGLVQGLAITAGVVFATGAAIYSYSLACRVAAIATGAWTVAQGICAAAAALLGATTGGVTLLIGSLAAALIAAVGGALYFSGALNGLGSIASQTMGGIMDAIAGGNLGLAWKIATTGMTLAWLTFTQNIYDAWDRICAAIAKRTEGLRQSWGTYVSEFSQGLNVVTGGALGSARGKSGRPERRQTEEGGSGVNGVPGKQQTETQKQIQVLTATLAALNEEAKKEREALGGEGMGKMPEFSMPELPQIDPAKTQFSAQGTFSSAAALLLGKPSQKIEEKMLSVAEDSKDELVKIREAVEEGGLVFA